jgi:Sec-independent protein translocase protein TatA
MPYLSTENVTLVIVLMFVLLVLALLLLPAASFIRLVELIRDTGSKVEAVHKEVQQVQTILSNGTASDSSSNHTTDTPITLDNPPGPTTESTKTTK